MAVPALKFEPERPVEQRVTRLEDHVEHIRSDVSEIKGLVTRLDEKIDRVNTNLSEKIETVNVNLTDKIDKVKDLVSNLAVTVASQATSFEKTIGALSTTMEKGFGDINARMEKGFGDFNQKLAAQRTWTLTTIATVVGALVSAVTAVVGHFLKAF